MSVNQSIKPITTEEKDNLYIGGCDLTKLAEKYGTPLYIIDEETLRCICREYKKAFKDYENIKMMYASKALCTSAIARILMKKDSGLTQYQQEKSILFIKPALICQKCYLMETTNLPAKLN